MITTKVGELRDAINSFDRERGGQRKFPFFLLAEVVKGERVFHQIGKGEALRELTGLPRHQRVFGYVDGITGHVYLGRGGP